MCGVIYFSLLMWHFQSCLGSNRRILSTSDVCECCIVLYRNPFCPMAIRCPSDVKYFWCERAIIWICCLQLCCLFWARSPVRMRLIPGDLTGDSLDSSHRRSRFRHVSLLYCLHHVQVRSIDCSTCSTCSIYSTFFT